MAQGSAASVTRFENRPRMGCRRAGELLAGLWIEPVALLVLRKIVTPAAGPVAADIDVSSRPTSTPSLVPLLL